MAAATVDDILADLPLGFASLILRPSRTDAAIERFLIVDADDETVRRRVCLCPADRRPRTLGFAGVAAAP